MVEEGTKRVLKHPNKIFVIFFLTSPSSSAYCVAFPQDLGFVYFVLCVVLYGDLRLRKKWSDYHMAVSRLKKTPRGSFVL